MGKSSVVYVVGLTLIIAVALFNINQSSVDALDAFSTYYSRTMAHNVAIAAANVATNKILFNTVTSTSYADSFAGGRFEVRFDSTAPMRKTLRVTSTYFAAKGESADAPWEVRDTIYAEFMHTSLSRFGWFTEKEENGYVGPDGTPGPYFGDADYRVTGDSLFGYAHTNSAFHLAGKPYFDRKASAPNAPADTLAYKGEKGPVFNGGVEWGRSVSRDTANMIALRGAMNAGNALPSSWFLNRDVGLEYISSGDVRVRVPWNTGAIGDTVVPLNMLSSNGVVGVQGGDMHIKGTYKGMNTVVAFTGTDSLARKGNIWIDGNIVAATNPRTDPGSTDMLGIVAERSGYISVDSARTSSSLLEIQAAIYCHNGEFTAERFWDLDLSGRVSLYGSLCQKTAGSMGVFTPEGGIIRGFNYSIRYDQRLLDRWPPLFPVSTKYRLLSWWEN